MGLPQGAVRFQFVIATVILVVTASACGTDTQEEEGLRTSAAPSEAVPPGAARCAEFDDDDANRKEILERHSTEVTALSASADVPVEAEIAFTSIRSWDAALASVTGAELIGFQLAYHPFVNGTTLYVSIDRQQGETTDQLKVRVADSIAFDLREDLAAAQQPAVGPDLEVKPGLDVEVLLATLERVEAGELPVNLPPCSNRRRRPQVGR